MLELKKRLPSRSAIVFTLGLWIALCMSTNSSHAAFVLRIAMGAPVVFGDQATVSVNATFTSENPASPYDDYINAYVFDLSNSTLALHPIDYSRFSIANVLNDWDFFGLDPTTGVGLIQALDNYLFSDQDPVKLFDLKIDLQGLSGGDYLVSTFKAGSTDASGSIAQFDTLTGTWEPQSVPSFYRYSTPPGLTSGVINFDDLGSARFSIASSTLNVVPEPASIVIMAIGACTTLLGLRLRKSRRFK